MKGIFSDGYFLTTHGKVTYKQKDPFRDIYDEMYFHYGTEMGKTFERKNQLYQSTSDEVMGILRDVESKKSEFSEEDNEIEGSIWERLQERIELEKRKYEEDDEGEEEEEDEYEEEIQQ